MLDDAAQGFGASYKGRRLGTFGHATATSFFPAKPLGCYGDGGAIFTDDAELAETLRSIRVHGQGSEKYDNVRIGLTARLDTMQAAILIEKLKIFDDEIAARNKVAERYARGLGNIVTVPRLAPGCTSVWAQYTIRLPKGVDRDGFAAALKAQGVPTAIYYPKSMHQQTAYREFPVADGGLPVSERLSDEVISLPMHAYLDEADPGARHRGRARASACSLDLPRERGYRRWRARAYQTTARCWIARSGPRMAFAHGRNSLVFETMLLRSGACSDASSRSAAIPCFRG